MMVPPVSNSAIAIAVSPLTQDGVKMRLMGCLVFLIFLLRVMTKSSIRIAGHRCQTWGKVVDKA